MAACVPYASLDLETRVAVGELLCGLVLESHRLRTHVNKSVSALQILGRCRNAELAKLSRSGTSSSASSSSSSSSSSGGGGGGGSAGGGGGDAEVRRVLARKYAAIRSLLGSYRRSALGVDRDGREYFVLGEQVRR